MTIKPRIAGALFAMLALSVAQAQESAAQLTAEERIVALERQVADLELRLQARGAVAPGALGASDIALSSRVEQLERALDRLAADLQRAERQADTALREASAARREAMEAARLAREARSLR